MSVVRLLSDGDFEEYVRMSLEAYPAMFTSFTDEQREGWVKRMQVQQSDKGAVQYAGCFRDGKLVGIMRLHSFEMNVHGTIVKAKGVGNVAVDLTRKKEQVSKEMMEFYHQWGLDDGASFAVLWPFRPDYYVKMGYGYGRKMNKYMFRPSDLPRGSKEGVRFMSTDDVDALHACFNDYVRGTHGMILKPRSFYERLFRRYKVVGYEKSSARITSSCRILTSSTLSTTAGKLLEGSSRSSRRSLIRSSASSSPRWTMTFTSLPRTRGTVSPTSSSQARRATSRAWA